MRPHHPALPAPEPPLIVSRRPAPRFRTRRQPASAGVAVVYATADGTVERATAEGPADRLATRFEVDTAYRGCRTYEPLPARHDSLHFASSIAIGWWVADPVRVVQERVVYGNATVCGVILGLARRISRRYGIEDCERVEDEINAITAHGPIDLPRFGIRIDSLSASITLDPGTADYLRRQVHIERTTDLQERDHVRQRAALRNAQELEGEQMRAVAAGVQGEFGLITMHLRQHPDQALQVLHLMYTRQQELETRHDARFANAAQLFSTMLDAGLLQDVDTNQIRDAVLRNLVNTVTNDRPPQPDGGHQPPDPSGVSGWVPRGRRTAGPNGSATPGQP